MKLNRTARLTAILALVFGSGQHRVRILHAEVPGSDLPRVDRALAAGDSLIVTVPASAEARLRSVLVSLPDPGRIKPGVTVNACLEPTSPASDAASMPSKALHFGDPDVVWIIQQAAGKSMRIKVLSTAMPERGAAGPTVRVAVQVADLGTLPETRTIRARDLDAIDAVAFEAEPNNTPESANPLSLGQTVYGLADDRPYLLIGEPPAEQDHDTGVNWFTFTLDSAKPRLAFFALDFVDRDVPPDVRIYEKKDGRLVEFSQGIDPQSLQRERPPRPGANKFTTRVIARGTYFVRVDACQPEYQLRTKLFDVPPYLEPEDAATARPQTIAAAARKAIRTAMDFQLLAGDSWHANTPRKGHHARSRGQLPPRNIHLHCLPCDPLHHSVSPGRRQVGL